MDFSAGSSYYTGTHALPDIYIYALALGRPESIMLQNLPIMLFSISQIFLPITLIFKLPKYKLCRQIFLQIIVKIGQKTIT